MIWNEIETPPDSREGGGHFTLSKKGKDSPQKNPLISERISNS